MKLLDGPVSPDDVFLHPKHQAAQETLANLIVQLRACANVKDGYEFQQALVNHILRVEEDRNAFSRAIKRMEQGKAPQAGVPDPQSGQDPSVLETWLLERYVCERLARQLRCVGDALAWRVFGFQRDQIIALCQNAAPGVMAGKEGLIHELACVEQAYRDGGQFAILHDLTNCLRIGDVTVFGNDGSHRTIEVKKNPERSKGRQDRQISAAEHAVRDRGPLPGKDVLARLYDLDVPYKTHLDVLRSGMDQAVRDGIFAAKIPGARMIVVTDFYGCNTRGWDNDEYQERLSRKVAAARRRAGLGSDQDYSVSVISTDSVSLDPKRVPFAAYPLHPIACARLIGDYSAFVVETSGPALAESVRVDGIDAEWVCPPNCGQLASGQVVMEVRAVASGPIIGGVAGMPWRGGLRPEITRTLQVRRSELERYLVELMELPTWTGGMRQMLADPNLVQGRPWPVYKGEEHIWI
jgi:hypothetical protein